MDWAQKIKLYVPGCRQTTFSPVGSWKMWFQNIHKVVIKSRFYNLIFFYDVQEHFDSFTPKGYLQQILLAGMMCNVCNNNMQSIF